MHSTMCLCHVATGIDVAMMVPCSRVSRCLLLSLLLPWQMLLQPGRQASRQAGRQQLQVKHRSGDAACVPKAAAVTAVVAQRRGQGTKLAMLTIIHYSWPPLRPPSPTSPPLAARDLRTCQSTLCPADVATIANKCEKPPLLATKTAARDCTK